MGGLRTSSLVVWGVRLSRRGCRLGFCCIFVFRPVRIVPWMTFEFRFGLLIPIEKMNRLNCLLLLLNLLVDTCFCIVLYCIYIVLALWLFGWIELCSLVTCSDAV